MKHPVIACLFICFLFLTLNLSGELIAQKTTIKKEKENTTNRVAFVHGDFDTAQKLLGAQLSVTNDTLDITCAFDEFSVSYWSSSNSVPVKEARQGIALNSMFTRARGLVKEFPNVGRIRMFFAKFDIERDKYGNPVGAQKIIQCRMELTPETINRINWEYAKNQLSFFLWGNGNSSNLLEMLDNSYFNPMEF